MFTKTDIEKYFFAEKHESILFMFIGGLAIVLAFVFFFYNRTAIYRGVAIPLLLVGAIQCMVGFTVFKRSDQQRVDMAYAYDMDPMKLRSAEVPRMEQVLRSFVTIRYTEIALAIVGLLLILFFRRNVEHAVWYGFGAALTTQALLSLLLDFFAEKRALEYLAGLKMFLKM